MAVYSQVGSHQGRTGHCQGMGAPSHMERPVHGKRRPRAAGSLWLSLRVDAALLCPGLTVVLLPMPRFDRGPIAYHPGSMQPYIRRCRVGQARKTCACADDSSKAVNKLGLEPPRGSSACECTVCRSRGDMATSSGATRICARTPHLSRPLPLHVCSSHCYCLSSRFLVSSSPMPTSS